MATACQPDGSPSLEPYNYKPWDASGFLQVTLGVGTLTFTQAKVIDVVVVQLVWTHQMMKKASGKHSMHSGDCPRIPQGKRLKISASAPIHQELANAQLPRSFFSAGTCGLISKSKISIGSPNVVQTFGMSTTEARCPWTGAHDSKR